MFDPNGIVLWLGNPQFHNASRVVSWFVLKSLCGPHKLYTQSAPKVIFIHSGDDDYLMNETRRKPTTRRQSPSLFDKWHGIYYMHAQSHRHGCTYQGLWLPSREELGGKPKCSAPGGLEPTAHRLTVEHTTNWAIPVPPEDHITPGPQHGALTVWSHILTGSQGGKVTFGNTSCTFNLFRVGSWPTESLFG